MSGIVGMFERGFDGSTGRVDRQLLSALTRSLSYRGPDAREIWADGVVGFGHTLLRTARESGVERQPASFEGRFWVVADARIDCRRELETELEQAGIKVRQPVPDFELIVRAYAVWGKECVRHLRGDFAFAIWDPRNRELFCARDHFGVKPFYYAEIGSLLLFSNTLNCLRLHPELSDKLNEAAIGDFLLFGANTDGGSTTFDAIRRLPAAHTLTATSQGIRIARYWSAPVDGETRYRHSREYVEHFQLLVQSAVADRLRTDQTAILLSGGLDSACISSVARELSAARGTNGLKAFTVSYKSEEADAETAFARTTAGFLSIPHEEVALDHVEPFERRDDPEFAYPEPMEDPFFGGLFRQFQAISTHARTTLSGEGADNLMHFEMWPFASRLLRGKKWARFLAVSTGYLRVRRFPWRGIRYRVNRMRGKDDYSPRFPAWLEPDFVRRLNLQDRWKARGIDRGAAQHPVLPKGHASLSLPHWSQLFEASDPGVTRSPVEVRYPFLDLRVVNYLLSLSPFPWFYEKMLLREAMMGKLPEAVRVRTKTPFVRDPLAEKIQRYENNLEGQDGWSEEIRAYVSRAALQSQEKKRSAETPAAGLRPLCLNFWLQTARYLRYNIAAEARNA